MLPTGRLLLLALFALNLAGGVLRWSRPDTFGTGAIWDLTGLLDVVRACDAGSDGSWMAASLPESCWSVPPYLPLALPLFSWMAAQPAGAVASAWFATTSAAMLAIFARESSRWASKTGSSGAGGPVVPAAVFLSLVAFKGSSLGLLSGQPSITVAILLYAFTVLYEKWRRGGEGATAARVASLLALAAAASKPNIAAPFFVWFALRRDWHGLAAAATTTGVVQLAASFLWLGPPASLDLLLRASQTVGSHPLNALELLGASGRVDLAPLLAVLGIGELGRTLVLALTSVGGLALLWRLAPRLDPRLLLLETNVLFVALLYHRDYDLVLLVLLALPALLRQAPRLGVTAAFAAMPFVLPLQWIHATGMQAAPWASPAWNFLGCSMVLGVVGTGTWLLWAEMEDSGERHEPTTKR